MADCDFEKIYREQFQGVYQYLLSQSDLPSRQTKNSGGFTTKLPCATIQDLLPLYHDGVCSPESRTLVEEHLSDCAACRELLDALSRELEQPPSSLDEAKPLAALGSAWKKGKKRIFFKGTLLAVLACAVLFAAYWGLTRWKIVPVSPDVLEVSELSRLADGRILYHLNVKDDKNLYFIKFTTNPDGSYYIMNFIHDIICHAAVPAAG